MDIFFYRKRRRYACAAAAAVMLACGETALAQQTESADTTAMEGQISEVSVVARQRGQYKKHTLVTNDDIITSSELLRAACCNLGESFTTNPSVDVSYSDAATGARQIRLLGLSGTYVQMLSENIPNYRGAAAPYALGYIPGPWMQSIQVSKGASSVKNGYESITGQINVEFKKPQATPFLETNLYTNSKGKSEANFDGNLHLTRRLTTALLLHGEWLDKAHDGNGDGFMDLPKVKQYGVQNRWAWMGDRYVFQASLKAMKEWRDGGQTSHGGHQHDDPYLIDIDNERYEAFTKNAYIFNKERATNVALILSGSFHREDATFGAKNYHVNERNGYASLMFETDLGTQHNISTGLSINYDSFRQHASRWATYEEVKPESETVPGAYAQYTYKLGEQLTLMAGLRADHSNRYGTFVTPRAHLRYSPVETVTLRASVGKGYRTPHALAENNYLLASGRRVYVDDNLKQEEAWNYGVSVQADIPLFGQKLNLNAEYYYTDFRNQMVIDMDSDPHAVSFGNLSGDSYSHTVQFEAGYPFFRGFMLTATYRRSFVKCTYGDRLLEKPLASRYKGLLSASYSTPLRMWQFDLTLQMNGGGRLPEPYTTYDGTPSWGRTFKAYSQLNAQVTREFRHVSIYVGGENLYNTRQHNPIVFAEDPWSPYFDSTLIWGPLHGAVYYIGVRLKWNQI